ncbi:MAG: MFS transporter [Rhodospirillaceae bacterium]|nr:MFS transporter [Rhodospirillaceae bacterium]
MTAQAATNHAEFPRYKRNISLLFVCWALASTSMMLVVTVTALVGASLAENKALMALPIAIQWYGSAFFTVPASFIMVRVGRRNGFLLAAGCMCIGSGLAILAIFEGSFPLYCLASLLVGFATGFQWYYRFAAAEVVPESFRSRAISLVLAGGVVAAIIGPTLALYAVDWLAPVMLAGAYVAVIGLQFVIMLIMLMVNIAKPPKMALRGGRPLMEIAKQPKFMLAVAGGVIGYGIMVLLMSITPKAMEMCGLDFAEATQVIQWHVLGMYVPAFFTGHLIKKFGPQRIMLAGGMLNVACLIIAMSGIAFENFLVALLLLGVGWNFLYTGATTLLTETYTVAERAKTQALNEFLVFTFVATATFFSGVTLQYYGWQNLAIGVLPLLLIVLAATVWIMMFSNRRAQASS